MVLFANEPPTYRDAMYRAFRKGGRPALLLPLEASVEDIIGEGSLDAVVVSGGDERARRLSQSVPVVNLTYGEKEMATVFVRGEVAARATLDGFTDLEEMIELSTARAEP